MKKIIFLGIIFIASATGIFAQSKTETAAKTETVAAQSFPENFKSDGCTHFPDKDYRDCCVQHDLAYFNGGSWTARWRADSNLRKCVAAKNGWWHKPVSIMMWSGVRLFAVPFLPTKFRWGFGKDLMKKQSTQKDTKTQK